MKKPQKKQVKKKVWVVVLDRKLVGREFFLKRRDCRVFVTDVPAGRIKDTKVVPATLTYEA